MAYKIYCDEYLIFDSALDSLRVINPKVSNGLNAVGSCEFTIMNNHPYYEKLQKMKSIIKVFDDDVMIFKGRILNDKTGLMNEKKIECESDVAFLFDSIQRPYEFQGSPLQLLTMFINQHNAQVEESKQFIVGNVTVTDANDYIVRSDTTYETTYDAIQDKLIDKLGGYIWIRHEANGNYIDYLADFNVLSNQTIEFGKNLLSFTKTLSADDLFTIIVPLGASDADGNRVNIKSVNNNKDYLESTTGIAKFGRIVKVMEWDDVTIPNNLKTKAQKALDDAILMVGTIDITAADMSSIRENINSFKIGTKVKVICKNNGLDDYFLVKRITIDLVNPSSNVLSLGTEFKTLTDKQSAERKDLTTQIVQKTESVKIDILADTSKQFQSDISATSDMIMSQVSEKYYLKGETDQLISDVNTTIQQNANTVEFQFNSFSQSLNDLMNGTDAQFENIRKYIRFENGSIYLGEVGNQLELQISNDRISFLQNNSEVAYFSNNKLFVTDGEYTNSLQLGKFAFLPRTSGNLSFKKVRD